MENGSPELLRRPEAEVMKVRCTIAGGGPAGMVAGFLLARAGVEVVVLEKHTDFLRDFRGDTIHPSTFELMCELGLLTNSCGGRIRNCRKLGRRLRTFV